MRQLPVLSCDGGALPVGLGANVVVAVARQLPLEMEPACHLASRHDFMERLIYLPLCGGSHLEWPVCSFQVSPWVLLVDLGCWDVAAKGELVGQLALL